MRYITVAEDRGEHKPKDCDHKCRRYALVEGIAWRLDVYGQHEVVEIDEGMARKAEYTYCLMQFDGRQMAIFKIGEQEYLQPTSEDPRATEKRLGKKRKIRKVKAPRRDAPGVARAAVSWENEGPAAEEDSDQLRTKRRTQRARLEEPGPRPYRRAGPRGGLRLEG